MRETFVEYREVSVAEPLRQGDVLEAVDPRAAKWQRHLVVITADCDFANAKNHGRVTCAPLLTQDEYLLEFQIPRVRDRVVAKSIAALEILLKRAGCPSISSDRLREWPNEQSAAEIVEALGLNGSQRSEASKWIESIHIASELPPDLDGSVERLVAAQVEVPGGKSATNAQAYVTDVLRSHYLKPPGDALFLSAIAPGHSDGYFAYLRHLEQIREPEIAIGPARGLFTYRRLARLQDRFTHALSQQFAMVFMAIGLPREYEEIRDLHSEIMRERYK